MAISHHMRHLEMLKGSRFTTLQTFRSFVSSYDPNKQIISRLVIPLLVSLSLPSSPPRVMARFENKLS